MSEKVNKPPTLQDIMIYGKSLIESGSNANISVIESPVRKSSNQLPITSMVGGGSLMRKRMYIKKKASNVYRYAYFKQLLYFQGIIIVM